MRQLFRMEFALECLLPKIDGEIMTFGGKWWLGFWMWTRIWLDNHYMEPKPVEAARKDSMLQAITMLGFAYRSHGLSLKNWPLFPGQTSPSLIIACLRNDSWCKDMAQWEIGYRERLRWFRFGQTARMMEVFCIWVDCQRPGEDYQIFRKPILIVDAEAFCPKNPDLKKWLRMYDVRYEI